MVLRDALAATPQVQIPGIAPIAQLDRTSLCHLYWGLQWRQFVGAAAVAGQWQFDGIGTSSRPVLPVFSPPSDPEACVQPR